MGNSKVGHSPIAGQILAEAIYPRDGSDPAVPEIQTRFAGKKGNRANLFPWHRLEQSLHQHSPIEEPMNRHCRGLRRSAVVALLQIHDFQPHDPELLLIERSKNLRTHAGQLAFPGGKEEPHDDSLLETALREANEEIGLEQNNVRFLGRLAPVITPTNFIIVPFVARVLRPWLPKKCSAEVANILRPTISELRSNYRAGSPRLFRGKMHPMHEYTIHDPPLWGATARMVHELIRHLDYAKPS